MTLVLRYLLDENLRGRLWHAIQQHNRHGVFPVDAVRVGGPPDLLLGTLDPDILRWAEREGRILVSLDKATLPGPWPSISRRVTTRRAFSCYNHRVPW